MIPITAEAQAQAQRSPEMKRLDAVRRRLSALEGAAVTLVYDSEGAAIEIIRPVRVARGRAVGREAPAILARFAVDAASDEAEALAAMPDDMAFVLGLLVRAFRKVREMRASLPHGPGAADAAGPPAGPGNSPDARSRLRPSGDAGDRPKDFAAEAAMKCQNEAFQKFLGAADAGEADRLAKHRAGYASKRDLNTDVNAANRWRALVHEFDMWLRGVE